MALGLPNANISFKSTAATVIKRGERGIVYLILKQENFEGYESLPPFFDNVINLRIRDLSEIPDILTDENRSFVLSALRGGYNAIKEVRISLLKAGVELSTFHNLIKETNFDYLAIPSSLEELFEMGTDIKGETATQINTLRANGKKVKAVLDDFNADNEGIINFAVNKVHLDGEVKTGLEYTARIAGILAGTPLQISATFYTLAEVLDVENALEVGETEDEAIAAGKLILHNDGEQLKIARGINSFVQTTSDKGGEFKKIKIVDILDMIYTDIKRTIERNYIGKYANSYDNKVLLISAIQGYLDTLVSENLLDAEERNEVFIDFESQRNYLKAKGIEVSEMSEEEIIKANTDDKVFLSGNVKPLDAIEEISLNFFL